MNPDDAVYRAAARHYDEPDHDGPESSENEILALVEGAHPGYSARVDEPEYDNDAEGWIYSGRLVDDDGITRADWSCGDDGEGLIVEWRP